MNVFSNKLKCLRLGQNLTQPQLAHALNVSKSTISMYENAMREPNIAMLIAIADYFDVSIDVLVGHKR